jgi:hypothetical protein
VRKAFPAVAWKTYINAMNRTTVSALASGHAPDCGNNALPEAPAEKSIAHYSGGDVPKVPAWVIALEVAALAAVAYFVYNFAPVFEHNRTLPRF